VDADHAAEADGLEFAASDHSVDAFAVDAKLASYLWNGAELAVVVHDQRVPAESSPVACGDNFLPNFLPLWGDLR
jgi:hypothetical protein